MEALEYKKDENLTITSDMELFDICLWKDKEWLMDIDRYRKFIKETEKLIRHSVDYSNFISVISETLDHCQFLGHISKYDAKLECHHNFFSLYDYVAVVTNALLERGEKVTTFKVAKLVMQEHYDEHVNLVMLCKTAHEAVDTGEIFINLSQGVGNLNEFLKKYRDGLTEPYIDKLNEYIKMSRQFRSTDNRIFELEDAMVNWSYKSLPNDFSKRLINE